MNTDQVLIKTEAGPAVDEERLLHWAKRKLIPSPALSNDVLTWPQEAWWEACAAFYLLDTRGWTETEVQIGRFYMGDIFKKGGSVVGQLDWFFREGPKGIHGNEENYLDSFGWAVAAIKAQKDWPLHAPADITVKKGLGRSRYQITDLEFSPEWSPNARLEYKLEQTLKDVIREEGSSSVHPREIETPMGAYLG